MRDAIIITCFFLLAIICMLTIRVGVKQIKEQLKKL
jgi:hypothetical protein